MIAGAFDFQAELIGLERKLTRCPLAEQREAVSVAGENLDGALELLPVSRRALRLQDVRQHVRPDGRRARIELEGSAMTIAFVSALRGVMLKKTP